MNEEKTTYKPILGLLISALIAFFAIYLLSVIYPISGMLLTMSEWVVLLLVLATLPVIFVMTRHHWVYGTSLWLACGVLAYYLIGMTGVYVAVALLLPIGVCTYIIRAKKGAFESLVFSCCGYALAIGLICLFCLVIKKEDPLTWMYNQMVGKINAVDSDAATYYPFLKVLDLVSENISVEQFLEALTATTEQMARFVREEVQLLDIKQMIMAYVPYASISFMIYGGLLGFFVPRAICKKTGLEVGNVPAFSNFALPGKTGIYLFIVLILSMIPTLAEMKNLLAAGEALRHFAELVFAVQGLAFLEFFLKQKIKAHAGRIAILIVLYLLLSSLVSFMGMIEQVLQLRKRIVFIKKGE